MVVIVSVVGKYHVPLEGFECNIEIRSVVGTPYHNKGRHLLCYPRVSTIH